MFFLLVEQPPDLRTVEAVLNDGEVEEETAEQERVTFYREWLLEPLPTPQAPSTSRECTPAPDVVTSTNPTAKEPADKVDVGCERGRRAAYMRELQRQDRFLASSNLRSDQSQVGVALGNILLKRKKKEDKLLCKFCNETISRSNMHRHIKQSHTWCTYCNKIHPVKVHSLIDECPMFDRFWKMVYVAPF